MSAVGTEAPLGDVARRIAEHAGKSDELVIAAAKLMREARRRVEEGEVGLVTWSDWASANIALSKSRLHELEHIAKAKDPEAELERLRRQTYERVKRHREKKAAAARATEQARQDLIAWAKEAPIDAARRVLDLAKKEWGGAFPGSAETRSGEGALDAA